MLYFCASFRVGTFDVGEEMKGRNVSNRYMGQKAGKGLRKKECHGAGKEKIK
jgi:hypothetical protein